MRHELVSGIESGEVVALEGHVTGTHDGTLVGPMGETAPTGRRIDIPWAALARVEGGRVASFHGYWDAALFIAQLGLLPEPAATTA
jgi:ketosteroid isomerase-like protein